VGYPLKDKVALITGGCRGIGKSIAEKFAEAGAKIVISCRNQPHLDEVASELQKKQVQVLPLAAHNRKIEQLDQLFEKTVQEFGRIDILVNNAAVNPAMGPLVEMEEKAYDVIMLTNLKCYTYLSQLVGKRMVEQGEGGNIINISSAGGVSPDQGLGLYCISKAGINMLTKVLASELGPYRIRVNAIAPGLVKTKFSEALWSNEDLVEKEMAHTPLKYMLMPEDIANTAYYLATDQSSYTTGQILVIDGGTQL